MWELVPPAPRVPDPQAPARVRDDSAGDSRATHTHTHAHSRTHARARKPRALWALGSPAVGGQGGDVGSPLGLSLDLRLLPQRHCSICTPFFKESARIFMERLARGRPAPRPPQLLLRPGDGLRGAPGSPAHGTVPEPCDSYAGLGLRRGRPSRGPRARPRLSRLRTTLWDFREGGPTAGGSAGAVARRTSPRVAPPSGPGEPGLRCLGVSAAGGWGRGARRGNPAEGSALRKGWTQEAAKRQKRVRGLKGGGPGSRLGVERASGAGDEQVYLRGH